MGEKESTSLLQKYEKEDDDVKMTVQELSEDVTLFKWVSKALMLETTRK